MGGRFGDLRTIYQGCRALPFALAGLSCINRGLDDASSHYLKKAFRKQVQIALPEQERHTLHSGTVVRFKVLADRMSKACGLSFLLTVVGLLIMTSIVVNSQPTVDDNPSCDATTQTVIDLMARGFLDVKKLLGALHQTRTAVDSSTLCEYKTQSLYVGVCLCMLYLNA